MSLEASQIVMREEAGPLPIPSETQLNAPNDFTDYSNFLKEMGFNAVVHGPWATGREANRVQGWKIHLSSVMTEAAGLLCKLAPWLRANGARFKVAKDQFALLQLNEGALGATQVGKFITLYPESDEQAVQMATQLVELTRGFRGPVVVTDVRLGDVVYTRYGGFNPVIKFDRLGQVFPSIYTAEGTLRPDSYEVPFVPPPGIVNPFADFPLAISDQGPQQSYKSTSLLGPGYLVLEVVKHDSKGSVFRGIDLRSQEQASIKIIKQGRQNCLSDEFGRDMRTRLKRQERLHEYFRGRVSIPQADPYFEVKGDAYLPLEFISGQSIETLAVSSLENQRWENLPLAKQIELLSCFDRILNEVQQLHDLGYVHRDLTASNIWIASNGQAYLLDLELAHAVDDPTPAFGMGTPGFMSPEQIDRLQPTLAQDIYALSCALLLLITGIDPRRLLFAERELRAQQWFELTGAPLSLIELAVQGLSLVPADRPALESFRDQVQVSIASLSNLAKEQFNHAGVTVVNLATDWNSDLHKLAYIIRSAQQGILQETITNQATNLWLSYSLSNGNGAHSPTGYSFELRRSANRGVAGVVYLLGRLARCGYATEASRARVQRAVDWLCGDEPTADRGLPGLHFGEAGVGVAIAEAVAGGLVDLSSEVESKLSDSLSGRVDWPDITHGAAGQGVAALYCADLLERPSFETFAQPCAAYLVSTQKGDGSWEMPAGVDGMTGETLTGFAHGVSGMIYFLAEYARRFHDQSADRAWQKAVEWLVNKGESAEEGSALEWNYSDKQIERWKWWCHGGPGIALTFLRLFEHTHNSFFSDIAVRALAVHSPELVYSNLSQCHGLSGLGEIYLEAARVLNDNQWLARANRLADVLMSLRRETAAGSITWLVEEPGLATADLMVGSAGVAHFFLRLSLHPNNLSPPLLLPPPKARR